jgi:hypothetical protein
MKAEEGNKQHEDLKKLFSNIKKSAININIYIIFTFVFTREQIQVHETRETFIFNSIPTFEKLNIRVPDNSLISRNLDKLEA